MYNTYILFNYNYIKIVIYLTYNSVNVFELCLFKICLECEYETSLDIRWKLNSNGLESKT